MEYVTSWERMAQEEGRKEGREEGLEFAILTLLDSRFETMLSQDVRDEIQNLNEEKLRELFVFIAVARSYEAVESFLNDLIASG